MQAVKWSRHDRSTSNSAQISAGCTEPAAFPRRHLFEKQSRCCTDAIGTREHTASRAPADSKAAASTWRDRAGEGGRRPQGLPQHLMQKTAAATAHTACARSMRPAHSAPRLSSNCIMPHETCMGRARRHRVLGRARGRGARAGGGRRLPRRGAHRPAARPRPPIRYARALLRPLRSTKSRQAARSRAKRGKPQNRSITAPSDTATRPWLSRWDLMRDPHPLRQPRGH